MRRKQLDQAFDPVLDFKDFQKNCQSNSLNVDRSNPLAVIAERLMLFGEHDTALRQECNFYSTILARNSQRELCIREFTHDIHTRRCGSCSCSSPTQVA